MFTLSLFGLLNRGLEEFRRAWNCHKLRTEKPRKSPNQLLHENRHIAADAYVDLEEYGVDENYDPEEEESQKVNVDPIACPLTPEQYALFEEQVWTIERAGNHVQREDYPQYFLFALQTCNDIIHRQS